MVSPKSSVSDVAGVCASFRAHATPSATNAMTSILVRKTGILPWEERPQRQCAERGASIATSASPEAPKSWRE
jgi:hypothetical protein